MTASPCPRGSTRPAQTMPRRAGGFPVPAGIDPHGAAVLEEEARLPRARGDRPMIWAGDLVIAEASPCPRGSTLHMSRCDHRGPGFPVPAGIDPPFGSYWWGYTWLPRARGDRPGPCARGSRLGWASPCPRGSTLIHAYLAGAIDGFPVPAGIDPGFPRISSGSQRLPRARGDRPDGENGRDKARKASPCPRGST